MNETCTQKTNTGICGKPAVAVMHWPGHGGLLVCQEHRQWAENIALAMGMYLCFDELPQQEQGGKESR